MAGIDSSRTPSPSSPPPSPAAISEPRLTFDYGVQHGSAGDAARALFMPEPPPEPPLEPRPGITPVLDVERADADVIAVRIAWQRDALCVRHLLVGESLVVGCEENSDFVVPPELGTLRVAHGRAGPVISFAGGVTARVWTSDRVAREAQGTVALERGEYADIDLGALHISVALTPAGKETPRETLGTERRVAAFFSTAVAAVASVVSAMALYAPPLGLTDDAKSDRERLYLLQQYLESAAERERELETTDGETAAPQSDADSARAAEGPAGQLGKPETPNREPKRFSTVGSSESPVTQMRREEILKAAENFGMIGVLASYAPEGLAAPWTDALEGRGDVLAMGTPFGDTIGDTYGMNGLTLSGAGSGGGDRGQWIAMNLRGTCLGGVCPGTGGFEQGPRPAKFGAHATRSPNVRIQPPDVSGTLASTVIQRVVRQNFGRFRSCYEAGLTRNPGLEGRVTARFVIARDGSVASVQSGGADLPDPGVVSCVLSTYRTLSFPAPEHGIVTVSYPIVFSPAA